MRIEGERESGNVEDRRGIGGGGLAVGGGVGTVILALVVWFMGGDPRQVVNQGSQGGGGSPSAQTGPRDPAEEQAAKFVRVVLAETEDVWRDQFRKQLKREYPLPVLVLFSGRVQSACGTATAASGPFYCPGDQKLYLDLAFFNELARRFKAPGDFAQAYVVAHEVGHHVQKTLGITDRIDAERGRISKSEYNKLSVRLELQADFLAGVWAHHTQRTKGILEPGDVEEAIRAAAAVGDDAIQKQAQGYVVPDSFTHGTSQQRAAWFMKGFRTGLINEGDAFNMPDPPLK